MSELVYRHDNGIKVDLFRVLDLPDGRRQVVAYGDEFQCVETVTREYPGALFQSPVMLRIWGTQFLIPSPAEYLTLTYGTDWQTPNPSWSPWNDPHAA